MLPKATGARGNRFFVFMPRSILILISTVCLLLGQTIVFAADWTYTVRPGDNLWTFTEKYLIDQSYHPRVRDYNQLEDSDRIIPGEIIVVPTTWLKVQPLSAKLVQISGEVQIQRSDGSIDSDPKEGALLNATDSVITQKNGTGVILFADESEVLLHPDTHITLDAISTLDETGMVDTSFRLRGGRVENSVNPARKKNTRFRVITAPAIAAVKGTKFNVSYLAADEITQAEVDSGLVGMLAEGIEVDLPAGFGSVTKLGEPPGSPRKRLTAPDLSALPDLIAANQVEFNWKHQKGAVSYFTSLYSLNNHRLIKASYSDLSLVTIPSLKAQQYLLRVVAIDEVGLYGTAADHLFWVDEQPKGPRLSLPGNQSITQDSSPVLSWTENPTALSYHLQVSESDGFEKLHADIDGITKAMVQLETELGRGRYHWRVSSISKQLLESDWSDSFSFTVIGKRAPPEIISTQVEEQNLSVSWKIVSQAQVYHLEVATDNSFEHIIASHTTSKARYTFKSLPSGTVYIRLKSIEPLAVESEYSPVVVIEMDASQNRYFIYLLLLVLVVIGAAVLTKRRR